jgi:hypothetical protein
MGTHELSKFVGNALENTKSVVLDQSLEEVLEYVAGAAGVFRDLAHDLLLVIEAEGWVVKNLVELEVLLENRGQGFHLLGGRFERRTLSGSRVLLKRIRIGSCMLLIMSRFFISTAGALNPTNWPC